MKFLSKILVTATLLLTYGPSMGQQRNVLFIAVDDLKPLLGAYGDKVAITPNIDRLAKMGVTFTNNHCQQAVCAPSRASLLTGLYPDLTEVWDLKTMIRDKNPNVLTLPQHFKNNGYETVGIGKIFDPRSVDDRLDSLSWSVPYIMPDVKESPYGEPVLGTYHSSENKKTFEEIKSRGEAEGLEKGELNAYVRSVFKPSTESFDIQDEGYFDGMVAVAGVGQLRKLSEKGRPFLLCVGFKKPHLPFVAPKKYWDMYNRDDMVLSAFQAQAANTVQLSYHQSNELKSYSDIPASYGDSGLINPDKQKELIHGYYACISYIDAQIGKLLDELEKQELAKSTSIVLWGDHGWHLGDHGLWNKHTNFEQATRSPLIFAGAGVEPGKINESPAALVDIFPTLCDLTAVPAPSNLQGRSLRPILSGNKTSVNDYVISQYPRMQHMGYALRNDRYRYVVWYKDGDTSDDANILAKELYDYKRDPQETVNIVGDKPEISSELQMLLRDFLDKIARDKRAFKKGQKNEKVNKQMGPGKAMGTNLLKNPGFENGIKSWRTIGKGSVEVVKEEANTGAYSLRFEGSKCGVNQVVKNLKPETTYSVSVYAKTEAKEAVVLKVSGFGGEDIKEKYKGAGYFELSTKFTTGKEHTSVKIVLQKFGDGSGKSWFDDAVLTEQTDKGMGANRQALKGIIEEGYDGEFFVGATIGYNQLNTEAEDILVREFNYVVPENAAKQTRVHPEPGKWNWAQIDAIVEMAQKNDLAIRLHGPISPQSSQWAKDDRRTGKELETMLAEFMTGQCKRFNGKPNIRWMDVVNETVDTGGQWFSPKPGVDDWENPWTIIGSDNDKNQTPLYISRAFEIANRYAPDISLVYNQHGGMEPAMWERVKETILYLKKKGLRVDGLGWQAHLRSDINIAFDQNSMDYLSSLIDWAHANDLDFHVTEIDYKILDVDKEEYPFEKQGEAYANILKVLLSKRASGVVTYNTWGILDGTGKHADKLMFMFDGQGNPKPAYYSVKEALQDIEAPLTFYSNLVFSDGFEDQDFDRSWKRFGDNKPMVVRGNASEGQSCVMIRDNKSGIKKVLKDLKPNTKYMVEVWLKSPEGMKSVIKVGDYGGEQVANRIKGNGQYQKGVLGFTTGPSSISAELVINRWDQGGVGEVFVDEASIYEIKN